MTYTNSASFYYKGNDIYKFSRFLFIKAMTYKFSKFLFIKVMTYTNLAGFYL